MVEIKYNYYKIQNHLNDIRVMRREGGYCIVTLENDKVIKKYKECNAVKLSRGYLREVFVLESLQYYKYFPKILDVNISNLTITLELLDDRFKIKNAEHFIRDIVIAMYILKKNHIIHRDIKLNNILYRKEDDTYVLSDFNTAIFYDGDIHMRNSINIEPYKAPETMSGVYNNSVDVYSFGMMLLEIKENYNLNISNELIDRCIEKDVNKRITIDELYEKYYNIEIDKLLIKKEYVSSNLRNKINDYMRIDDRIDNNTLCPMFVTIYEILLKKSKKIFKIPFKRLKVILSLLAFYITHDDNTKINSFLIINYYDSNVDIYIQELHYILNSLIFMKKFNCLEF